MIITQWIFCHFECIRHDAKKGFAFFELCYGYFLYFKLCKHGYISVTFFVRNFCYCVHEILMLIEWVVYV